MGYQQIFYLNQKLQKKHQYTNLIIFQILSFFYDEKYIFYIMIYFTIMIQLQYFMNQINKYDIKQKYLPTLSRKQPIYSVIQLIKLKKAEFQKQVQQYNRPNDGFPNINNPKPYNEIQEQQSYSGHQKQLIENTNNKKRNSEHLSVKYKNMADKTLIEKNNNRQLLQQKDKLTMNSTKNRIRTQNTQFQIKKQNHYTKPNSVQKVAKETKEQYKQEQEIIEQIYEKFVQAISKVPKNMKQRNQQNLDETVNALQAFNPFFNRNQRIVNICFLKMGKILLKDSPFQLYKAGQELDFFYIILHGRVKISQSGIKRICVTGETILQQIIFNPTIKKISLQNAKILGVCYLLQMKIQQYKKMKQQLTKYGLKQSFNQTQAIIKRNFITKNWMRNKNKSDINKF